MTSAHRRSHAEQGDAHRPGITGGADAVAAHALSPHKRVATPERAFPTLVGYMRRQWRVLSCSLALTLCSSASTIAIPLVVKQILDRFGSGSPVGYPLLFLLLIVIGGAAFSLVEWFVLGAAAERVVFFARSALIARLFRASVPELTRHSPGEYVTRTAADTILLREATTSAVIGIARATIVGIGTLVMMATLDIPLFLATVGLSAVVLVVFRVLMPRIARAEQRTQQALQELGGDLATAVSAIKTVKAFGAEESLHRRLEQHASEARRHSLVTMRTTALASVSSQLGMQLCTIVVLAWGAVRVDQGLVTVPTLVAFLLYAFTLSGPTAELSQYLAMMQGGVAAARRIGELERIAVEQDPALTSSCSTPRDHAHGDPPLLEMRSVHFGHGDGSGLALRDLSLQIPHTGMTALVGSSGAGKTTVLSLVMRFVEPFGGTISMDGRPYSEMSYQEVRERISYVDQNAALLPGSIRDNLSVGPSPVGEDEMLNTLQRLGLAGTIDSLPHGLDTIVRPDQLSGGERQRLALARALLRPSDLLIIDEATSQVDAITEQATMDVLSEQSRQRAIICVAHRISTIQRADRICVLDDGVIRECGTHGGLIQANGLYHHLVTAAGSGT